MQDLFYAALDLNASQRPTFLAAQCADDPALRAEVDGLLAAVVADTSPVTAAVQGAAQSLLANDRRSGQPTRLGPYAIRGVLGQGGMGTVYLAERDDAQFQQKVAIKVMRQTMASSRDTLLRFRAERQILASLSHPNIARLLDGGISEQGEPYLVMEYVDGEPITSYCDHHQLDTNARLALFRQVCAAVHFAHQNLIVHRDIKPANILVTSDGAPKLLDFGIAKLLKPEAVTADQTIAETGTHQWLMTPEYAAPEQIRGEAITTRTDVYALGAVLFELLTGRRPFDFKNTTPFEMARMIAEVEPPTTSSLRRALSPDLDNIILMAMRKQADRRYASVDQLSDDLRRFLEGFPVLARPDSRAYRIKKFVSRNKVAVAAATLAVLLLAGSAVAMAILAKRAQEEARAAQAVSDFLTGLFEVSNPSESRGNAITAREILDKGVAKINKDLGAQPAVQSRLLDTMGAVYDSLGLHKPAHPLLTKALDLREKLYGPDALETAQGLQTLATNYRGLGELPKAEPLLRRALAIRERRRGRAHLETLELLNDLGLNLAEQGRNEEAEKILAESLAGKRKLLPAGSDQILKTLNNYAVCLVNQSKFAAARPMFREILDSRRRHLGEDHPLTLFSYNNLGVTLLQLGQYEQAEPLLRTARFTRLRVLGPQHPMYFQSWTNHCSALGYLGRLDESTQCSRECYQATLAKQGIDHPQTLEYGSYVVERSILTGDLAGARTLALHLIPHGRKGRRERQRSMEGLIDTYLYSGDLAAAERALDDLTAELAPRKSTANSDLRRALLASARRQHPTAIEHARRALQARIKAYGAFDRDTIEARYTLASILAHAGQTDEARALFQDNLSYLRTSQPKGHYRTALNEAALYRITRDPALARSARESLSRYPKNPEAARLLPYLNVK